MSAPNNPSTNTMGASHHFFRTRKKAQNSRAKPTIAGRATPPKLPDLDPPSYLRPAQKVPALPFVRPSNQTALPRATRRRPRRHLPPSLPALDLKTPRLGSRDEPPGPARALPRAPRTRPRRHLPPSLPALDLKTPELGSPWSTGHISRVEESVSAPACLEEPRACPRDRGSAGFGGSVENRPA